MARFRSARQQADHAVRKLAVIGTGRHAARDDGLIHSIGTARNYRQALAGFAGFLSEQRLGNLTSATPELAQRYLDLRSSEVRQSQLDQDRQALQAHLGIRLSRIASEIDSIRTSRAYSLEQLALVRAAQTPRNAISTELAVTAGLRAHEMLTIRRHDEQQASTHRSWRPDLHAGRADQGVLYVVTGKGGLRRTICLPHDLADRLEARRLAEPARVTDRGVHYQAHYDIGGGQSWSASFSAASQRALGWSQGGHGCRHAYAQQRMDELQGRGYGYADARLVVTQELGHFRDLLDVYLR